MSDNGAQAARTTAIRLDSLRDQMGPQAAEQHQQLIADDGMGKGTSNCVTTCHGTELLVLGTQEGQLVSY